MTQPTLSELVTAFFLKHLAAEQNASPHTTLAYRDSLKLLLKFAGEHLRRAVAALQFDDLNAEVILAFLSHLETVRRNSIRTRNARLAAIHSFFRYTLEREPALSVACQRILSIPIKKTTQKVLGYLTEEELEQILGRIDRSALNGERDYLLLVLLYDTGARAQEAINLTPADFRFDFPALVRIHGKGRRERICPLLTQTARLVSRFLAASARKVDDNEPLLKNRNGARLTRHGVRYLLRKYLDSARSSTITLRRNGISPHTLRHTKAMHMLQAGIPLITVKDFLGHADIKTTEVYVQIDLEMKKKALQLTGSPARLSRKPARLSEDVVAWLESL